LVRRGPADAPVSIAASAGAAGAGAPKASQKPPAVLSFGPTRIVNGRVQFTDRLVKPSYTASLSELNGRLGAFASAPPADGQPQMAALELKGKAEGTASLEIAGRLNPLARPLALDITGQVRDLDLPALSPYSVKYVGHGIERGKLSMDVAYQVQPDGRLTARNSLVLRQLTFGEPVDGAPASLPVRLATALLADRNGVIDLDLPISGSLNDPQFSLGPVIGKALANLVLRAVTSPFTLLAKAFGGGPAAAQETEVAFAPGSAELSEAARAQLDGVARALIDRPSLQLTVVGTASLEAEREGFRRERLRQLTRFEKRRGLLEAQAAAGTADAPSRPAVADIVVTDREYPALLRQIYARTDMPKPRNALGLPRDVPLAEMEALLMAQVDVDEEAARTLAVRRGGAVRDYLAGRGVPTDRLFLGASRREAATDGWAPHAELKLAAR
uniref:DUF748 domain-containing protein n=1 Tax=uncultured Xylophilus sp. TaxID=296832 RepID=UPI0025F47E46